ncbi:RNA polymerase II subunit A C-terminal domain phosphatase-like isoform X2 [Dinothrombium tinctorium]|uniref:RNA polymerase II subunit A C-terminal domain phosphatase n=1 Tax=Dinothrombium tinctorium TaxID=1965070 RepID=A0A3S3P404_9ACAR|nr:RNA polymerase II subunit A C-terminal domain phosphatase-like isoform X2 [Dinothrombium tinctorium]
MFGKYDEECCRIVKFDGKQRVKLIEWKVGKEVIVSKGAILFVYEENGIEKKYRCHFVGTIIELFVSENCDLNPGDDLLLYQICLHPTVMKDLCAECGEDLRQTHNKSEVKKIGSHASVSMIHSVPELRVSVEHAEKLGKADLKRLLSNRKLVLLVDLDQTLIHTTNENIPPDMKDVFHFQLYGSNTPWYHTKIRPHTEDFLDKISHLFELHICTFGARMYAHKIASFLDPTEKLFSHRILSRDECFDPNSKTGNLKALFPCGDSMVCIIDDREDVWNFSPNVIAVKPYVFFKNTGDINSPYKPKIEFQFQLEKPKPKVMSTEQAQNEASSEQEKGINNGNDLVEEEKPENDESEENEKQDNEKLVKKETKIDEKKVETERSEAKTCDTEEKNQEKDETSKLSEDEIAKNFEKDDEDDYLLYLEDILQRIHKEYFRLYDESSRNGGESNKPPDLKDLVPKLRKETLKGVNVVFSGVIPTNMPPEKSKLWCLAIALGAKVQKDIFIDRNSEENTTHLIAAKYGTFKVNKAIKHRIKIVNPLWLTCCAERWEHVDERLFLLGKNDDFSEQRTKIKPSEFKPEVNEEVNKVHDAEKNKATKIVFPVYDPVTGKRINIQRTSEKPPSPSNSVSSSNEVTNEVEPHNMLDFSPLSAFSKNDLRMMDKEVDDACSEGDEMSTGNTDSSADEDEEVLKGKKRKKSEESSSEESLSEEYPKGWKGKQRKRTDALDDDETRESFVERTLSDESSDDFNESIGSVDEEMAAAVEREFLS